MWGRSKKALAVKVHIILNQIQMDVFKIRELMSPLRPRPQIFPLSARCGEEFKFNKISPLLSFSLCSSFVLFLYLKWFLRQIFVV